MGFADHTLLSGFRLDITVDLDIPTATETHEPCLFYRIEEAVYLITVDFSFVECGYPGAREKQAQDLASSSTLLGARFHAFQTSSFCTQKAPSVHRKLILPPLGLYMHK